MPRAAAADECSTGYITTSGYTIDKKKSASNWKLTVTREKAE